LSPLSLAEKCRIAFGAAVAITLFLALLIPYVWMGKLTTKAVLDAGRAKTNILLNRHFRLRDSGEKTYIMLDNTGQVFDTNRPEVLWIRFAKEPEKQPLPVTKKQKEMIESLKKHQERDDDVLLDRRKGVLFCDYVRIFRASDNCITCHNPQGSASPFAQNELVGAAIVRRPAGEISKTVLLNRVWVIVAGLIAATGAIIAFYIITQRVILRPVRQLRAVANNVAEGNLDVRSAIKSGDEYEKLAEAFNNMLDGTQAAQEKLRQANKQLDAKIAELSERNIELFKANQIKSEFLANISHEFRTPLNAILGFAEILKERPALLTEEKGRRYAENIIAGGKNLLNMINDLLDLAKTEAGKMKLHVKKISLAELCDSLVSSFSEMAEQKRLSIKLTAGNDIPPLTTDAGKVYQILSNFMSNAVKFTPSGGRIEIFAAMLDEKTVRIAVSDTGCGIAEADKKKIFEKFRQADGSITRQSAGSGLGLAISKELAAMLAGSVGLESELNQGSTFWLDIPTTLTKDNDTAG
jgi:signal transduction histidine kinase